MSMPIGNFIDLTVDSVMSTPTGNFIDLTGDSDDDNIQAVDRPTTPLHSQDIIQLTDSEKEDHEEDEEMHDEDEDDIDKEMEEDSEGSVEENEGRKEGSGSEGDDELDSEWCDADRELIYEAIDDAFAENSGDKRRREVLGKGRAAARGAAIRNVKVILEDYLGPPPLSHNRRHQGS